MPTKPNTTAEPAAPLRLLRKPDVAARTGLTTRGIDNRVKRGMFPRPVLLDARQSAWVEAEVEAWIKARVIDRDTGFVPPGRASIVAGRRRGGLAVHGGKKGGAA